MGIYTLVPSVFFVNAGERAIKSTKNSIGARACTVLLASMPLRQCVADSADDHGIGSASSDGANVVGGDVWAGTCAGYALGEGVGTLASVRAYELRLRETVELALQARARSLACHVF